MSTHTLLGRRLSNFRGATFLHTNKLEESDKAVKFQLRENEKITFWIPKAALIVDENVPDCMDIKHWFKFNDFVAGVWTRYERPVF